MIDKVCDNSICTACYACSNICPSNAITLKENEAGELFPVVSGSCIECGICQSVCPSLNPLKMNEPQKTYAVYSTDSEIRSKSASGGLVNMISRAFDGTVFGAAFTNGFSVEHIPAESTEELKRQQGSKYVHSRINNQFSSAKRLLDEGKRVLFTGTPCQIAGLKAYLKKDYPLLYTIDLVCHGVPEQSTLREYVAYEFPNTALNGAALRFRDESGWHMTLNKDGRCIGEIPFEKDYYYHGFLEGWIYREACYTCPYAKRERIGDITACDFWGITSEALKKELKHGLNGALINTEKGFELMALINGHAYIEERDTNEAVNGNDQLRRPSQATKYSDRFRRLKSSRSSVYALKNTKLKKKLIITLRKLKNAGNSNN